MHTGTSNVNNHGKRGVSREALSGVRGTIGGPTTKVPRRRCERPGAGPTAKESSNA